MAIAVKTSTGETIYYTPRPKKEKIDNTGLLAKVGVRVVHINPVKYTNYEDTYRAMTIAYKTDPYDRTMEVAVAVVHKVDRFDKKIGTREAVKHFEEGATIILPRSKYENVATQLVSMFGFIAR